MEQPLGVPAHPRISDAAARALVQAIMDAEILGALCVPLRTAERAVGVLFFDFDSVKAPEPGAVAFAENVAAHCAVALERARSKRNGGT